MKNITSRIFTLHNIELNTIMNERKNFRNSLFYKMRNRNGFNILSKMQVRIKQHILNTIRLQ